MKYLIRFNEQDFHASIPDEDEQRLLDTIKGLFVDREDDGFLVDVEANLHKEKLLIIIYNGDPDTPEWDPIENLFRYGIIEQNIQSVIDLMRKRWIDIDLKFKYKIFLPYTVLPFLSNKESKVSPESNDQINSLTLTISKHKASGFINKFFKRV